MQNTSTGSYIVYASLLVSGLAHFGWIISSNDALAVITAVIAVIGTIYQHYVTKTVVAKAIGAGVQGIR